MVHHEVLATDSARATDYISGMTMRGQILGGWRQQYQRMHRSYKRLRGYAEGETATQDSDEAGDALLHFFQDAYHLKDWIKRNEPEHKQAVESLFGEANGVQALRLCADLCNGSKHFTLTKPRLGGAFASHSVTVRPPPAGTSFPPEPALHSWTVRWSRNAECDAVELATACLEAWDEWLNDHALHPRPPTP